MAGYALCNMATVLAKSYHSSPQSLGTAVGTMETLRDLKLRYGSILIFICLCSTTGEEFNFKVKPSFLKAVLTNIITSGHLCESFDLLLDSAIPQDLINPAELPQLKVGIACVLNLPLDFQFDVSNITQVYRFYWPTRFLRLCTLGFSFLPFRNDSVSEFIQRSLPGAPCRSFFVYLRNHGTSDGSMDELAALRQSSLYIQNLVVSDVSPSDNRIVLQTRNWNLESLLTVGEFVLNDETLLTDGPLFPKLLDFEGAAVVGMVCPVCEPAYSFFKETGIWKDYMIASMHEMALKTNASLELDTVFDMPGYGIKEDGSWDDFVLPLVEGDAVFTAVIRPSSFVNKAIFLAHVLFFDDITFIHALPTLQEFSSLKVLIQPFQLLVWIGFFSSVLLCFVALLIFGWHQRQKIQGLSFSARHKEISRLSQVAAYQALFALLLPCVDQNGLANTDVKNSLKDTYSRCAVGIWFLSLIVIGCGYKSKIISAIVLPRYEYPPRTFQQLVGSDYELDAMFYTNSIEAFFLGRKDRIAEEILRRARERPYFSEECYHNILKGKHVCMGLASVFKALGPEFLTNENGKHLFLLAQESYVFALGTIGVTRFHPHLHEPFDDIVYSMEQSGLALLFFKNSMDLNTKKGRGRAGTEFKEIIPAFKSENYLKNDDHSTKQLVLISIKILVFGSIAATTCFLLELPMGYWKRRQSEVTILSDRISP